MGPARFLSATIGYGTEYNTDNILTKHKGPSGSNSKSKHQMIWSFFFRTRSCFVDLVEHRFLIHNSSHLS